MKSLQAKQKQMRVFLKGMEKSELGLDPNCDQYFFQVPRPDVQYAVHYQYKGGEGPGGLPGGPNNQVSPISGDSGIGQDAAAAAAAAAGLDTNTIFFIFFFLGRQIIDLPGGQINYP